MTGRVHALRVEKRAPSRARAHHLEQLDMSMVLHVTCWAQECVSQENGDHQRQNCLRGANSAWSGQSGAPARELTTRSVQGI